MEHAASIPVPEVVVQQLLEHPQWSFWPRRAQPQCPADLGQFMQELRALEEHPAGDRRRLEYHVQNSLGHYTECYVLEEVQWQQQRLRMSPVQTDPTQPAVEAWFGRCIDGMWRRIEGELGGRMRVVPGHEGAALQIPLARTQTARQYPRPEPVTLHHPETLVALESQ
jgi:hypothetical protein